MSFLRFFNFLFSIPCIPVVNFGQQSLRYESFNFWQVIYSAPGMFCFASTWGNFGTKLLSLLVPPDFQTFLRSCLGYALRVHMQSYYGTAKRETTILCNYRVWTICVKQTQFFSWAELVKVFAYFCFTKNPLTDISNFKGECSYKTFGYFSDHTALAWPEQYLQPHYGNGVFGNVYFSAGQHKEVNIAGNRLP